MSAELSLLLPEIVLLVLVCTVLLIDVVTSDPDRRLTYWSAQLSLLIVLTLVVYLSPGQEVRAFANSFVNDSMGVALKAIICSLTLVIFFYSYDYLKKHQIVTGEYFVLGLFAVLGMMIMCSAASLLTIYLGLELLSLSLYAMVAMHRKSAFASEAAMKYFVLGALASGLLLYGMSMLYGVTGVLDLQGIAEYAGQNAADRHLDLLLVFGLVFIIVGIAFKFGAAPFHMWVPDVYEGSPTAVTLFIASAPKVAAFAMAVRLLTEGLQWQLADWQGMLVVLSLLSMAAGNIIAISQTNIKRMLAYSTIAHVGFLFLGLISGTESGYAGAMFYIIVYAMMSLGTFGMVILLGRKGFEADKLDDFRGLARRSPWYAFLMMVLMFSMAGVPPLVGFWAKWFVIKEVIAMGYVWLAAVAVVFSVVGAFYYLRVVKLMFFDEPASMTAIKASHEMRFVLSLNGLMILLLGFTPGVLMTLCIRVFAG